MALAPAWLAAVLPQIRDKEKAAVLSEQVSLLQMQRDNALMELLKANTALSKAENDVASLKRDNAQLNQELNSFRNAANLAPEAKRIVLYLFEKDRSFSPEDISVRFGLQIGVCRHHFDALHTTELISLETGGIRGAGMPPSFSLTEKGRSFAVANPPLDVKG